MKPLFIKHFPPFCFSSSLCLTFPQPPNNYNHCVWKTECKTLNLEVPFCFVFQSDLWVSDILMWLFLWFGHQHIIQGTLILKTILHRVQRIDRNRNLQIFTKWTNCGGNCITGNVARVWRMWGVKVQILRRFSAQEHDTDTFPVSAVLWNLSFTKYISVYLYTI